MKIIDVMRAHSRTENRQPLAKHCGIILLYGAHRAYGTRSTIMYNGGIPHSLHMYSEHGACLVV